MAAERAIVPDELRTRRTPVAECLPSVGMAHDGTPLLAFLAQDRGATDWELWVMPIAPAGSDRGPQVRASAGRKLAEGCARRWSDVLRRRPLCLRVALRRRSRPRATPCGGRRGGRIPRGRGSALPFLDDELTQN